MNETTETPNPLTYAAAKAIAEPVDMAELVKMFELDDNGYCFPGPRKKRRIMMNARFTPLPGRKYGVVGFDYCNRNGYTCTAAHSMGSKYDRTIINFDSLGRVVYLDSGLWA